MRILDGHGRNVTRTAAEYVEDWFWDGVWEELKRVVAVQPGAHRLRFWLETCDGDDAEWCREVSDLIMNQYGFPITVEVQGSDLIATALVADLRKQSGRRMDTEEAQQEEVRNGR